MDNTKSFNGANIVDSVSLISFARSHGQAKFCKDMTNKTTGEVFDSLAFVDGDEITFVAISEKLGQMSAAKIKEMKNELQVIEFDSGNYMLCKKGNNSWEDIDLI